MTTKLTPEQKAARDAERAARYPSAAKTKPPAAKVGEMMAAQLLASAEKAPAKKTPAKKTTRPAKPAKTEVKAEKKSAPKTAAVVAFVARTVKPGTKVHVLPLNDRPSQGAKLFAHTHAALTLLGLLSEKRPAVSASALLAIVGQRAVSHHKSNLNLEDGPNKTIRLSATGLSNFRNRKVDNALANDYLSLFIDGKVSKDLGHDARALYVISV